MAINIFWKLFSFGIQLPVGVSLVLSVEKVIFRYLVSLQLEVGLIHHNFHVGRRWKELSYELAASLLFLNNHLRSEGSSNNATTLTQPFETLYSSFSKCLNDIQMVYIELLPKTCYRDTNFVTCSSHKLFLLHFCQFQ